MGKEGSICPDGCSHPRGGETVGVAVKVTQDRPDTPGRSGLKERRAKARRHPGNCRRSHGIACPSPQTSVRLR